MNQQTSQRTIHDCIPRATAPVRFLTPCAVALQFISMLGVTPGSLKLPPSVSLDRRALVLGLKTLCPPTSRKCLFHEGLFCWNLTLLRRRRCSAGSRQCTWQEPTPLSISTFRDTFEFPIVYTPAMRFSRLCLPTSEFTVHLSVPPLQFA